MIYAAFALSFIASLYSVRVALQSHCDRKEAHIALVFLPTAAALVIAFGYAPFEKIIAIGILFMAGLTLATEPRWRKIFPLIQLVFAIWLLIALPIGE